MWLGVILLRSRVMSRAANDPSVITITEKAPAKAFSWLKAPSHLRQYKDTMLTNPPIPYDFCVYLPWGRSAYCLNSVLNVKALSTRRRP